MVDAFPFVIFLYSTIQGVLCMQFGSYEDKGLTMYLWGSDNTRKKLTGLQKTGSR